ncbi:response regulator transcription factor [Streptomyces sp. CC77]|uniref:helix-turn-helix transcriptional regulator n=1 Tax=Streptomyces sp. CC77 TaxID=1906739 RepID=UPI000A7013EC|nr:response regulator transcription factor [Streptomyces sp. CC77]
MTTREAATGRAAGTRTAAGRKAVPAHGNPPARTAPVRVAVHAADPLTHAGLAGYVEGDRRLLLVDRTEQADTTVLVADTVGGETLGALHRLAATRATGPFLVVVGTRWTADIALAAECGVRAVLWRRDTTPDTFTRALVDLSEGGGSLPPDLQGRLLDQIERTYRDVLIPQGLAHGRRLTVREADILRLISEGCDLAEIAEKLAYSERTVKNILYRVMGRLELRNRAHAVSYAIRSGLI